MNPLDPVVLAQRQLTLDRKKTARYAGLFERKVARMSASPLAFLRGAAPLFYEILEARPELAKGASGEGWLTGDLHLENFGAYRPAPMAKAADKADKADKKGAASEDDGVATFNLNDFDDAIIGPLRFDVLRLTTSLILGGRELGADGKTALDLSELLVTSYSDHLGGRTADAASASPQSRSPALPVPRPVKTLIEQVSGRTRLELLAARTTVHKGERRFVRGDRYRDLPDDVRAMVPTSFAAYAAAQGPGDRPDDSSLRIVDAAMRIAGTGSLGGLRIAVLVAGKGGVDGGWVFDMKEQGEPSASLLLGATKMDPAVRVVTALRACLERPPRRIGTARLGKTSMFVRRLAPQEDKLDLTGMHHDELKPLAIYLGALVGAAHRRGATKPVKAWTASEKDELVTHAIALAGVHEATYLALCKLTRS